MRRCRCRDASFLLAFSVVASQGTEQTDAPRRSRFEAGVSAVFLDVAVTAPTQAFLPELTARDFAIYEDGVLQQVSFFASSEDTPLTFVLLLDASTSIRSAERDIRNAASRLIRDMSTRERAAVVVFSDTISRARISHRFQILCWKRLALCARPGKRLSMTRSSTRWTS